MHSGPPSYLRVSVSLTAAVLFACGCRTETAQAPGPGALPEQGDIATRMGRVTSQLAPPVRLRGTKARSFSLQQRMHALHVPGVSIAVADNGRIAWTQAFGRRAAAEDGAVTPTTLFQAASIGKALFATASLRLVEQQKLDLDRDVNERLRSWKLPDNEHTQREKVTLRRILSHTAGTNVHGFVRPSRAAPSPSLLEILEGRPPATNEPIRVVQVPGTAVRYSGGGVAIELQLIEDVTGARFQDSIRQLVFEPLGMTRSTIADPLPDELVLDAAAPHDSKGHVYTGTYSTSSTISGPWATPADLLRWAIAIANAERGEPNALLAPATARLMTHPHAPGQPTGLGTFVEGEGAARHFGHGGRNEGFACEVIFFPERGQGAAVMLNGDAGGPLVSSLIYAIGAELGWPDFGPEEVDFQEASPKTLEAAVGQYITDTPTRVDLTLTRRGARLFAESVKFGVRSEAVLSETNVFFTVDEYVWFTLSEPDAGGNFQAVEFAGFVMRRVNTAADAE